MNTINIFDFEDPRVYLKKIFELNHIDKPKYYTYEKFATVLGFSNKGFIYNYMYPKGKNGQKTFEHKKLMKLHCENISSALNHSREESRYFNNIVNAEQAADEKEQRYYQKEAAKIRSNSKICLLTSVQTKYYSKWYHSAIRSLLDIYRLRKGEEHSLCQYLFPSITIGQVKKSIKLLLDLNLIAIDAEGYYRIEKSIINTGNVIPQDVKDSAHIRYIELAKKAIREVTPDSRYVISHTIGVSKETYLEITKEIEAFRSTLRNLIDTDVKPERVYQLELVLFPFSKEYSETEAGK